MLLKRLLTLSSLVLVIAIGSHDAQAAPPADLPSGQPLGVSEQVFAFHHAMPTAFGVIRTDRITVTFPRPGDNVPANAAELLWPDTLSIRPDGYLYFPVNQLRRQGTVHTQDLRQKPDAIWRMKIGPGPTLTF